jgi:hypothetical protein
MSKKSEPSKIYGLILFSAGIATRVLFVTVIGLVYMLTGGKNLDLKWKGLSKKDKRDKVLVMIAIIVSLIASLIQAYAYITSI